MHHPMNITKERPINYASSNEFIMTLNSPPLQKKLNNFLRTYSTHLNNVEQMTADLFDIINTISTKSPSLSSKRTVVLI